MSLLLVVVVAALVIGAALWRKYGVGSLFHSTNAQTDSPDDSAIIAYYSAGHSVTSAGRSTLNGMKYSIYVTLPGADGTFVDDTAVILALDLPFNTQTHILGLSKQHTLDRLEFANFLKANTMQPVDLEGDFPNYFDIYATEGQDVQVREVLNPKSMQFVVDYWRSHFWEINCSELYIVATENDREQVNLITQSQQFVEQIKPVLLPGAAGAAPVTHAVPYGEYDGPPLPCPVCQKIMVQTDNWFACPVGQGVLLSGRDIIRLRQHELKLTATINIAISHGTITCPNCHNAMTQVNYEDSGVEIDSCEHCPYRWLDANEVNQLGSKIS